MFRKIVTAAFAAALAIALSAPAVEAQKALVYCPVGIDAAGCDRIVTALQSSFPDGVDRGYDGSNSTVDLKSADLQHYGVFVVPSLADDAVKQPYALLRSVASRLHFAINGRVAVYSGAPDQGNNNRGDKDALIQNLATWAANGHTRMTGVVGLVAFLDLSEQVGDRYSWVRGISLADVSADAELQAFSDVTPVSTRGGNVLSAGGRSPRFANMASYGLHIGRYAAARTEVGALGGGSKSQSVLVMYSNADGKDNGTAGATTGQVGSSGASMDVTGVKASLSTTASTSSTTTTSGPAIATDKPDYQPGDTVTFTGTGFAPGDTVTITVHEDPTWSYPDRQFTSVADGNGAFVNRQMVVDKQDLGVTFTATAVAVPSGLVAQTTFTDGSASATGVVRDAVTNAPIAGATVTCDSGCTGNPPPSATTDATGAYCFKNGGGCPNSQLNFSGSSATVRLTASASGYVSQSARIQPSNAVNPVQDFALNPVATKLAFTTSPLTGTVGQCLGPITVQTQNAGSTPANVTSNTTVNLATDNGGAGAGAFYGSNTCTSSITGVLINAGSNSASFYYSATARGTGTHALTASATGLTSANQNETINRADQAALTATAPTSGMYGDHLTMTATGGSGSGALSFAVVGGSTACSILTTAPDSGKLAITAGTGTCSFTATKAQDNDYSSQTSAPLGVTVSKKTVTVATLTASNKVYDATTAATPTGGTLSGVLAGDEANVGLDVSGATATFADKNVGNGKTVTATGLALNGSAASNYVLNPTTATTTANITPLTITGAITASNKVYDGTTSATIATRTLTGVLGSDVVSLTGGTAAFADKNVGTGKTVTATGLGLSGGDAGNYALSSTTATTTADITPASLTGAFTAPNKVYDGTTAVSVSTRSVTGKLGSDDVNLTGGTATFDTKNVGTNKTVTLTGATLAGADAGNYSLAAGPIVTHADIAARALVVTATGQNKVYDGATTATVTLADDRVAGDVLTDSYAAANFSDKNVGTGKTVSVTGISISGTDAGNYTANSTTSTTADISALAITGHVTANDKVYDGTTTAVIATRTLTGAVAGDVVSYVGGIATFGDKNVGNGKTVTATGLSLSGAAAGNYTVNTTATTTANITPRALTIAAHGVDRLYDGTTAATVTLSDDRISGDGFSDAYTSASFADKNVGTNKTVSVTGIGISGADAGNYAFNTTATTTASITPRPLVVSATGVNKVYDGNATATVTLADNRVSGDVFTDSYTTATFNNKNVGTSKPVSVSGISILGTDAGNYSANTTANTTADITPRALTVAATGVNKVYDGTTAATVTLSDNRVSGDMLTDSYGSAAFADKNVGTGKSVSVSGIALSGTDAGNYTFNTTASTTADITPRALTIAATGVNKVYDASASATVTLSDNRVSGDVFTDSYVSASFADKNVGNGKQVTVSGISISGVDVGNYTFNTTTTTTANITPLGVTGDITANDKVYDGTVAATLATRTLTGVLSGDAVSYSGGTATFADKNVGNTKTVTATGLGLSGADAGNYTVNTTATTTASITPRALHVAAAGVNKVYDNSTGATVTLSDDRVSGDALTTAYTTATFASKDVGNGIAVSVTGITVTGTDAGNYTFNTTAATTANIAKRPVTVTVDDKQVVWTGSTITPAYTISLTAGTMAPGETFYSTLGSPSFAPATVVNVGVYTPVTVSGLSNANYAVTVNPGTLTVLDKTAPVGSITSLNPVPLNTSATLTVNINDVNTGNSDIDSWQYTIDGGAPVPVTPSSQTSNLTQSVTIAGFPTTDVKKVCIVGTDHGGNTSVEVCALLAVYDPSAGFVTGGGWINSPLGAYAADTTLVGKANFGFTSKYQKGATVPTGNTEFQFQAAGLNFSSTNFQWLVIQSDNSAQFKGTGTINGKGSYNFMVTAVDGDNSGSKKPDAFRIKITDLAGNTVYDNQMGKDDSGTFATTLGGGSIVIHSK